jgi:hypothetical protein
MRLIHRAVIFLLTYSLFTLFDGGLELKGEGRAVKDPTGAAADVIAEYHTDDPSAQVKTWQAEITHPSGNPEFKKFQADRLREWEETEFARYRLNDPKILALAAEVIRPVLRLYGREACFKLIIIAHSAPVAMNDSSVILMMSTGLIERATSDDELLGHVAHEVGHDLFWRRTAKARQILELYQTKHVGTDLGQRQAFEELMKIELECDAFSAVSLAVIGRNSLPTARSHEAVERDYPDYMRPDLPPAALRAKVIEGVVPASATLGAPQTSEAFTRLKAAIAARSDVSNHR